MEARDPLVFTTRMIIVRLISAWFIANVQTNRYFQKLMFKQAASWQGLAIITPFLIYAVCRKNLISRRKLESLLTRNLKLRKLTKLWRTCYFNWSTIFFFMIIIWPMWARAHSMYRLVKQFKEFIWKSSISFVTMKLYLRFGGADNALLYFRFNNNPKQRLLCFTLPRKLKFFDIKRFRSFWKPLLISSFTTIGMIIGRLICAWSIANIFWPFSIIINIV